MKANTEAVVEAIKEPAEEKGVVEAIKDANAEMKKSKKKRVKVVEDPDLKGISALNAVVKNMSVTDLSTGAHTSFLAHSPDVSQYNNSGVSMMPNEQNPFDSQMASPRKQEPEPPASDEQVEDLSAIVSKILIDSPVYRVKLVLSHLGLSTLHNLLKTNVSGAKYDLEHFIWAFQCLRAAAIEDQSYEYFQNPHMIGQHVMLVDKAREQYQAMQARADAYEKKNNLKRIFRTAQGGKLGDNFKAIGEGIVAVFGTASMSTVAL